MATNFDQMLIKRAKEYLRITDFDQMLERVIEYPKRKLSVAVAQDHTVLKAVKRAYEEEVADSILVGDKSEILRIAEEREIDISRAEIINKPDHIDAARQAVELVSSGDADIVMKGYIHSDDFLRAVLDRDIGLRSGYLMSHIYIIEVPLYNRLLFITDGGMNIAPTLVEKTQIILNAVYLAHIFGIEEPKVAVLSAVELVNPAMPSTIEAALLKTMSDRGQFPSCIVDGPLALDNVVSIEAAKHKGIVSPVAGQADIILAPDVEAGNTLAKSYIYLAGGRAVGVVIGARAPVVLTSRADSAETKFLSIATAVLMIDIQRTYRVKIGKIRY